MRKSVKNNSKLKTISNGGGSLLISVVGAEFAWLLSLRVLVASHRAGFIAAGFASLVLVAALHHVDVGC